jgi:streptomycin 6-kinase
LNIDPTKMMERGFDAAVLFSNDDEKDVRRCNESLSERRSITITGLNMDGNVAAFTGVVQSVVHDEMRDKGRRYKITILDE